MDFSDDKSSSSSLSATPSPHIKTERSGSASPRSKFTTGYNDSYDHDHDGYDGDEDENGMKWHAAAWCEDAIRESVSKLIEYNERMGLLASLVGVDENYPVEWDELQGKLYREMRYQEGLRKDLNELLVTTDG